MHALMEMHILFALMEMHILRALIQMHILNLSLNLGLSYDGSVIARLLVVMPPENSNL
jgi:hypothetical protein